MWGPSGAYLSNGFWTDYSSHVSIWIAIALKKSREIFSQFFSGHGNRAVSICLTFCSELIIIIITYRCEVSRYSKYDLVTTLQNGSLTWTWPVHEVIVNKEMFCNCLFIACPRFICPRHYIIDQYGFKIGWSWHHLNLKWLKIGNCNIDGLQQWKNSIFIERSRDIFM